MKPSFKKIMTAALAAGSTAALINSVLFFLFRALGIITDDVFVQDNQPLTVIPVILSSLVPSLLAGVAYYFLSRYTRNGYRIFSIVALVLLLLSFANPFVGIRGITVTMGIALNVMHIVVVACLLYFFKRTHTSALKHSLG
jgi:hypothetical protein